MILFWWFFWISYSWNWTCSCVSLLRANIQGRLVVMLWCSMLLPVIQLFIFKSSQNYIYRFSVIGGCSLIVCHDLWEHVVSLRIRWRIIHHVYYSLYNMDTFLLLNDHCSQTRKPLLFYWWVFMEPKLCILWQCTSTHKYKTAYFLSVGSGYTHCNSSFFLIA